MYIYWTNQLITKWEKIPQIRNEKQDFMPNIRDAKAV